MDKSKQEVERMTKECNDLLVSKNKDYSNDNLIKTGKQGISSRIVDKAHRLFNLSSGQQPNHEAVEDTLKDIINYAHLYNLRDKKLLKPKYIMAFLSGPIDDISESEANGWRDVMSRLLLTKGISTFNPATAYKLHLEGDRDYISQKVIEINKSAIVVSDLVIVNMAGQGMGFGTIREVEYARSLGKEVIIIGEIVSLSAYDCLVFKTMKDFYDYMGLLDAKEKWECPLPKKKVESTEKRQGALKKD